MRGPRGLRGIGAAALFSCLLQGCGSFSRLARHSDPLTPEQHVALGASYEAQGLKDDARREYAEALGDRRTDVPALMAEGNLAFAGGDFKAAMKDYRRVLWLDRNHAGANNNMAMALVARGKKKDLKRAERYAGRALKQGGPLKPYVLDTLASIYLKEGRGPEALKALDDAYFCVPPENEALRKELMKSREKFATSQ